MAERPAPLPHHALRREDLPGPRAPFEEVVALAYRFDGYEAFGMRLCGEMANRALGAFQRTGELPAWLGHDLDRLRACLYFEARRWIVLEREPDTRSLIYVHRLISAIGDALDARDQTGGAGTGAADGAAR
ncbi:MAG: hypothetical protein U5K81_04855 [Trueperaceae bacterium]|nr:hypothetical protein [Trueperaceae bacterium]